MNYTSNETVTVDDQEVEVTCAFEYTPADRGSWRDGQQQEPDEPENIELLSAKTEDGTDIADKVSAQDLDRISTNALEEINQIDDEPDYEPDYDDDDYIGPD